MHEGVRRYSTTFGTPAQAAAAREELKGLTKKRTHRRVTLALGFQRVLDRGGIRQGTQTFYEQEYRYLTAIFEPETGLATIDDPRLFTYMTKRESQTGTPSIKKELVMLGRIFKVCIEDELLKANPVPLFMSKYKNRLATRKKKPRCVHWDEWSEVRQRMLDWKPSRNNTAHGADLELDRLVPLFLYTTGLRLSEFGRLPVRDIDLENSQVFVDGKRDNEMVPLSKSLIPDLRAFIKSHGLSGDDLIANNKSIQAVFKRWRQRLDILWTPHALRHGLGTLLAKRRHPLKTIMEILRHSGPDMALHYQQVTDESCKDAVDSMFD